MSVPARLRELLQQALQPVRLDIRDDSARHAGHAGAAGGGHYAVAIVAEGFAGRRELERHRMIYAAAAPLMQHGIHALQISALTPAEAAAGSSPIRSQGD